MSEGETPEELPERENREQVSESGEAPSSSAGQSISQRKIEANRINGSKSTGPRTERGKSHSRRNSTKHGILTVVVPLNSEDDAPLKKLLHALQQEHPPVGEVDKFLVQQLADCYLKQRRVNKWEAGLIQRRPFFSDLGSVLAETGDGPPPAAKLDLLLRYQAAVQKQTRYVLEQLERRQRARKGKDLPYL